MSKEQSSSPSLNDALRQSLNREGRRGSGENSEGEDQLSDRNVRISPGEIAEIIQAAIDISTDGQAETENPVLRNRTPREGDTPDSEAPNGDDSHESGQGHGEGSKPLDNAKPKQ